MWNDQILPLGQDIDGCFDFGPFNGHRKNFAIAKMVMHWNQAKQSKENEKNIYFQWKIKIHHA